jgi:hypothetical protein
MNYSLFYDLNIFKLLHPLKINGQELDWDTRVAKGLNLGTNDLTTRKFEIFLYSTFGPLLTCDTFLQHDVTIFIHLKSNNDWFMKR